MGLGGNWRKVGGRMYVNIILKIDFTSRLIKSRESLSFAKKMNDNVN